MRGWAWVVVGLLACGMPNPTEPDIKRTHPNAAVGSINRVELTPATIAGQVGDVDTIVGCAFREGSPDCQPNAIVAFSALNPSVVDTVKTFAPPGTSTKRAVVVKLKAAGTGKIRGVNHGFADTTVVTVTDVPPPPPPPPPDSTADGCPVSGYLRLVNVSTPAGIGAAVAAALPGDQIRLAPGTYSYTANTGFNITRAGTPTNRIVLCGPRTAIISRGIINMQPGGNWWHLKGFRMDGGLVSVFGIQGLGGHHNIYDSLFVHRYYQEGIVLKIGPSNGNEVRWNSFWDLGTNSSGVKSLFGECVYLGNGSDPSQSVDSTWVHHNDIKRCTSEGIEIKSGSDFNVVEFNVIDSTGFARSAGSDGPIEIRSNGNRLTGNTIIWSNRASILIEPDATGSSASNNVIRDNTAMRALNNRMISASDGNEPGAPMVGNIFGCDNVAVSPEQYGLPTQGIAACTP